MKKIIGFLSLVTMITVPSVSVSVLLHSCGPQTTQAAYKQPSEMLDTASCALMTNSHDYPTQRYPQYQVKDAVRRLWIGRMKPLLAKMILVEDLRKKNQPDYLPHMGSGYIFKDGHVAQLDRWGSKVGKNALFFFVPEYFTYMKTDKQKGKGVTRLFIEVDTTEGSECFKAEEQFESINATPMISTFRFEYNPSQKSYILSNDVELEHYYNTPTIHVQYEVNIGQLEDYYAFFNIFLDSEQKRLTEIGKASVHAKKSNAPDEKEIEEMKKAIYEKFDPK